MSDTTTNPIFIAERPDWSKQIVVSKSFQTSIYRSRDATEQRQGHVLTSRLTMNYKLGNKTDAEAFSREIAMKSELASALIVPVWTHGFILASTITGTTFSGTPYVPFYPYRLNGYIFVDDPVSGEHFYKIASFGGSGFVLTSSVTIHAQSTVYPCIRCVRKSGSVSRGWRFTDRSETLEVEELGATSNPPDYSQLSLPKLNDIPVLSIPPSFEESVSESMSGVQDFAAGFGGIEAVMPDLRPQNNLAFTYTRLTQNSAMIVENFFESVQGRLESFWLPSWKNQLLTSGDQSQGQTSITIPACGFNSAFLTQPNQASGMYVFFYDFVNPPEFKKVTGVTTSGSNEALALDSGLSRKYSFKRFICGIVYLVRFSQDILTGTWLAPGISQYKLSFIETINWRKDAEPQTIISGYNGSSGLASAQFSATPAGGSFIPPYAFQFSIDGGAFQNPIFANVYNINSSLAMRLSLGSFTIPTGIGKQMSLVLSALLTINRDLYIKDGSLHRGSISYQRNHIPGLYCIIRSTTNLVPSPFPNASGGTFGSDDTIDSCGTYATDASFANAVTPSYARFAGAGPRFGFEAKSNVFDSADMDFYSGYAFMIINFSLTP